MIDGYLAGYDAWNECHPDNPEYLNDKAMSNKENLLPSEIALRAIEEKYPANKQFDEHYYLPKNLITLLRASADWGVHWGWKNPLPWKIKPPTPSPKDQPTQKTLRWVKASERLPTLNKTVYIKDVAKDGSVINDHGELKNFQSNQPCFSGTSRMYVINDPEYTVYWLEEVEMASEAGMSQEDFDRQTKGEISKMSDELSAQSDIAAIQYGQANGIVLHFLDGDCDISADLTNAFLAGQSWMYHKMQEEIEGLKLEIIEWKRLYNRVSRNY